MIFHCPPVFLVTVYSLKIELGESIPLIDFNDQTLHIKTILVRGSSLLTIKQHILWSMKIKDMWFQQQHEIHESKNL